MRKLDRLRGLSSRDFAVLSQLVVCSVAIAVALRVTSWRRVSRAIIAGSRMAGLRRFPLLHLGYSIEKLNPLVEMASSVFPKNRCLVRSMILLWLLRARGESAEVVLGVRKRAGNFEAHAWTVSERGLIGERPEAIAEFAVMTTSANPDQL
jgi:hypothetical protein